MTISCANCSSSVAPSGRRPADPDTPRFCVRPGCQAARQAAYRARLREADDSVRALEEVRPCSGCSAAMPVRPGRSTDLELGRWCPRRACQRDRGLKMALAAKVVAGEAGPAETVEVNRLFWEAMRRERHKCPKCFLVSPAGFKHPTMEGASCSGLGDMPVLRDDLHYAFPERFPRS